LTRMLRTCLQNKHTPCQKYFSVSLPQPARRLPHKRFPLTNEQLAQFGGKRSLQKRLVELGLSPVGFRVVLRERIRQYCENPTPPPQNQTEVIKDAAAKT